jgi:glycosyltransferase involved in cell wall biosynthesis
MRNFQLLRHLSRRHAISLLTYRIRGESDRERDPGPLGWSVHTVDDERPLGARKRRAQLASLLSPGSFQRRSLSTPAMQGAISRLLAEGDYDVVQVEQSQLGGVHLGSGAVSLLDEHNLEYEVFSRALRTEPSPVRRLYNLVEFVKVRHEERCAWKRFDGCIVTSRREQAVINRYLPTKPTVVVPNGVDLEHFQPSDRPRDPTSLVFTGSIDYRPNADAVTYFVREIFPEILQAHPDATFTVVGMRPPDQVKSLAGRNIIVTGQVPDVRPYLARASVVVVPLRMGSGTRLKLLEAMAMGAAVVSTTLGCEGLAVRDSEHLLVADPPHQFARDVVRLLNDSRLAGELGRRGRALVEREYGWASAAQRLDEFLVQMVASKRAAHPALRSTQPRPQRLA